MFDSSPRADRNQAPGLPGWGCRDGCRRRKGRGPLPAPRPWIAADLQVVLEVVLPGPLDKLVCRDQLHGHGVVRQDGVGAAVERGDIFPVLEQRHGKEVVTALGVLTGVRHASCRVEVAELVLDADGVETPVAVLNRQLCRRPVTAGGRGRARVVARALVVGRVTTTAATGSNRCPALRVTRRLTR